MKVLFVSSGNASSGISPIIKNQGSSLQANGIEIDYFTVNGKGLKSYIKHIFLLHTYLRTRKYDIVHAHYSYSAYMAALAGAKPLVVSLMGSDVSEYKIANLLIYIFNLLFWEKVIVKSNAMELNLGLKNISIIPNGVDTDKFSPLIKQNCLSTLKWDISKKHILFAADPNRPEKNFMLFKTAFQQIANYLNVESHCLDNISNDDVPLLFCASDLVVLTSTQEGSPNVIKEAMACNCVIVSTAVGDVRWVFGDTNGCYLTTNDPNDIASKMKLALEFNEKNILTLGRKRIFELGLDSDTVALKIISLYKNSLGY